MSLDPEVRTFLTGYNPTDLKCLEIGKRECTLKKLGGGLRKSINLQCTLRDRAAEAGKLEEAENRSRHWHKVKTRVNAFHRDVCSYLVSTYKTVILGKLNVSTCVLKKKGGPKGPYGRYGAIGKKTRKEMLDWRHYAFRERLVYRAKGHPNCQVLIQDEHKNK